MSDVVTDDEILYRCVFNGLDSYYHIEESGMVKLSSQAFTDRTLAPSVDRAKLCDNDPKHTQKNPSDGVVSLITSEVRMINISQNEPKGNPSDYKIDVCPRPTPDNLSHAQIEPSPEYKSRNHFRKLTLKLAFLATERIKKQGWEIKPSDLPT